MASNPAAVQRILRHSDPRITTEVHGHLAPEYLKSEVDRLRFGAPPPVTPAEPEANVKAAAVNAEPFRPTSGTLNHLLLPSPTRNRLLH